MCRLAGQGKPNTIVIKKEQVTVFPVGCSISFFTLENIISIFITSTVCQTMRAKAATSFKNKNAVS